MSVNIDIEPNAISWLEAKGSRLTLKLIKAKGLLRF